MLRKHSNGPFVYININPRARRVRDITNKWAAKIDVHNKIWKHIGRWFPRDEQGWF